MSPNIALGVQPVQFESPLVQTGRALELQGAAQRNQLAQMQMAAAQRDIEATNALNAAYQAAYNPVTGEIDINKLRQTLSTGGFGAKLPAIEESIAKAEKEKLQQKELKGKIDAQPVELASKRAKAFDDVLKQRAYSLSQIDPASPDAAAQFIAWHQENHKDPILGPELAKLGVTADQVMPRIRQLIVQPGGVDKLIADARQGIQQFAAANTQPSDLARLQSERAAIVAINPNDPRVAQFDAAIAKLTTVAEHGSELSKLEKELADRIKANPNDPAIPHYKAAIKKATEWKPQAIVVPAAPTLSKDAIEDQANRFLIDGTLPPLGMGRDAVANRNAIINRASQMARDQGVSADRITQLENKANASALTQLTKQETMVGAFEKNFTKNVKIVENLTQKKDSSGVPLLQKWINVGKKSVSGDPDLAALNIAIKAVQNEYGKIVSGSMGNTAVAVSEIRRMEDLLNAAQNPEDIQAVLNTMKQETQNRMAGFKEQKTELTGNMRGKKAEEGKAGEGKAGGAIAPYSDAEKERRYQEWKAKNK